MRINVEIKNPTDSEYGFEGACACKGQHTTEGRGYRSYISTSKEGTKPVTSVFEWIKTLHVIKVSNTVNDTCDNF
jgi:hypothetical protein